MGAFLREIVTSAIFFAIPCLLVALLLDRICDSLWQHTFREKLTNFYKYAHSHLHLHLPR